MLTQLLIHTAQRYPDQTALQFAEHSWNWQQFLNTVEKIAQGLDDKGIQSGSHVGLWLNNTPCFAFSLFALLARGAIVVPLNPAMKKGDFIHPDIALDAVITSKQLFQQCQQVMGNAELQYLVCPDPESCQNWNLISTHPLCLPILNLVNQPALLMYSSGSTGQPKTLYRTHQQCFAEIKQFKTSCQITNKDIIFCALPLFHSHGLGNTLFAAVGIGASLILMKNPQPFSLQWHRALDLLETKQVTIFPAIPYLLEILVTNNIQQASCNKHRLNKIRLCFSAGNALPTDLYQQFLTVFGISVRQLYGCTEAGSVSINLSDDCSSSSTSVGHAMNGIKISLFNKQSENEVETGEIAFFSQALTRGYLNNDALNAQHFKDGWFISGDIGRFDKAGRLYILGRKNSVMIIAGHKVYPDEVVSLLLLHPNIAEVAVIAVNDEQTGQAIKAFIVSKPEQSLSELTLAAYCQSHIAQFKRPKYFIFVNQLPKTPLGKVAKDQLSTSV